MIPQPQRVTPNRHWSWGLGECGRASKISQRPGGMYHLYKEAYGEHGLLCFQVRVEEFNSSPGSDSAMESSIYACTRRRLD